MQLIGDHECIICMTAYNNNENIIKLPCQA